MPSIEELEAQLRAAREAEELKAVGTSVPQPVVAGGDRYAATAWGSNEFDFTTPSGQLCRLRNIQLEKLAETGILDQITRLPGLTGDLVKQSQGLPPGADVAMPDKETIEALEHVLNTLVPLVVVAPVISDLPRADETGHVTERREGRIYVDSIAFEDRVAILNKVVGPLRKLDSFRNQS